jgi:predicted metal-dependent HD superfamily phosphohydrolase
MSNQFLSPTEEKLQRRWFSFCYRLNLDKHFIEAVWAVLYELYQIPKRSYHTLDWHINQMLLEFDNFKELYPHFTDKWDEIEWAIWFHDIYSIPGSINNEYNSMLLGSHLSNAHTELDFYIISWCILATTHGLNEVRGSKAKHLASMRPEQKLICDLDLSGFVTPETHFMESQRRIRKEYPDITDEEYCEGRKKFLQALLDRGYIFLTEEFYDYKESLAKQRIKGTIEGKYDATCSLRVG